MRYSSDTDRTKVELPSGRQSGEHLDTLTEKRTIESLRDEDRNDTQYQSYRQPFNSNGPASSSNLDQNLEKGQANDDPDDNEKAEEIRKQKEEKEKDPNLVEWDGPNDPENPMNWPTSKKWIVTITLGMMTFCVTFASSVFSNATLPTAEEFGVSTEVTTLGTSLFVFGFGVGPLIWGPGSEVFGRKLPLFFGYAIFAIFQIPIAVAQNLQTIMICRFLGGCFACSPLAIVGGALADFWGPVDRGIAVCVFSAATFIGPVAGPIMGGFITQSHLGWRWTAWITLIMASFFGTIGLFIVPETSHGKLLQTRAKKLRFETKNWAIHSKFDEKRVDFHELLHTYFFRPFIMLVKEPILMLVTIYMALIYGILYLFFEAYPISFQEERGWNLGVGALPFLGILIGVILGSLTITWITKTRFARKLKKHGKVIPEERLPPMIIGAFILPVGLFWFAWTSSPNITWVPQVLAGIFIGWGILMIFLQGLNYIIDVYMWHANSAIAANTMLRSLAGGGFPMFATAMCK
jgi:DHA1 family multidrug resistance protein-like MFS transporter